ncbi:MAG: 1-acyl-sn-glycerol-3-phosphate acyltransferase [Bacteroidales bacterium]|nr:1-acyl-sn-glycerol-3-phosphate acyltransferase [Bacteroidales bacterium]
MSPKTAGFLLYKVLGWKCSEGEDSMIPEEKVIFLAAPHTSIWDFVYGYLYYRSLGGKLKVMIKKEAFFFPFGILLRALGGFPIDRSHPQKVLMEVVHEMQKPGTFHLCICPEGTRKAVSKWKTGYHSIAMNTGATVYLGHYDYRTKTLGHGYPFKLSGDARADTDAIQKAYESMALTALHPEGYTTK